MSVEEQSVVHFPEGIMPFGASLNFALLPGPDPSATAWLQSLEHPELAFWVGHAAKLFPGRNIGIEARHLDLMQIQRREQLSILLILTIQDRQVTANLLAPLLINGARRVGRQVILAGDMDLIRLPVPAGCAVAQPA